MLADDGMEVRRGAVLLREEDLAFAYGDELLQIEGHALRGTEVLEVLRQRTAQIAHQLEEMGSDRPRCEDHRRVLEDIYLLVTELPSRQCFEVEERLKYQFQIILLSQLIVR